MTEGDCDKHNITQIIKDVAEKSAVGLAYLARRSDERSCNMPRCYAVANAIYVVDERKTYRCGDHTPEEVDHGDTSMLA